MWRELIKVMHYSSKIKMDSFENLALMRDVEID
jgi:hypothetical protein